MKMACTSILFAVIALALWMYILKSGGAQRLRVVDTSVSLTQGGDPKEGRKVIQKYGCGACHRIPGVPGAVGKIGPDLTGFGAHPRRDIGGVRANNEKNLFQWIKHPQRVDPKTAMPDLELSDGEVRDAAAYLLAPRRSF